MDLRDVSTEARQRGQAVAAAAVATQTKLGRLDGLSVAGVLQILEMESLTCSVVVGRGLDRAELFVEDGGLVHVKHSQDMGRSAALEVLLWTNVSVEIAEGCHTKQRTIVEPLSSLMLDAACAADEEEAEATQDDGRVTRLPLDEPAEEHDDQQEDQQEGPEEGRGEGPLEGPREDQGRGKEMAVNVKKLGEAIDGLKGDLGEGLVAADVWAVADGVSLGGHNSNPAATAVFNKITDLVGGALKDAHFPELNRYWMLDLADGKICVVMPAGEYRAGMLVDSGKVALGIVLSVALPKFGAALQEAMA